MILAALSWWLSAELLGWAAFPIAFGIFHRLRDRGFGISRALGLLAAGYLLWLGGSLHLVPNSIGGAVGVSLLAIAAGAAAGLRRRAELWTWIRGNWRTILVMEALFFGAFAVWAFVRASNPDITATEKPMELAFLNSILRSPWFPPPDPWLSGYAISYYYFGYVLLAFLTRLTGVSAGIAFNLGSSLWFALTALGAYSVVFNLLAALDGRSRLSASLVGPLFLLVSGNLEGFLDVLWARHAFWRAGGDGQLTSAFWSWLDIQELTRAPSQPPTWLPYRDGGFWWWRASRVIHDVNLAGSSVEVIDEFPFFSFLLADNHPHLLALPFVLAAVSLALQVALAGRRQAAPLLSPGRKALPWPGLGRLAAILLVLAAAARTGVEAAQGLAPGQAILQGAVLLALGAGGLGLVGVLIGTQFGLLPTSLGRGEFWTAAWLFGALAFLNTWDFPIYLSLLLVVMLWAGRADRPGVLLGQALSTAAGLAVGGVLLFLPWYPTFASQASGILPNLAFPTRLPHFLVMFGTLLIPLCTWLIWKAAGSWHWGEVKRFAILALALPVGLFAFSWLLAAIALIVLARNPGALNSILAAMGAGDIDSGIQAVLQRRFETSWTALILGAIVSAAALLLFKGLHDRPTGQGTGSMVRAFLAAMVAVGGLLVLAPEFVYLRDLFEDRMNTVFKFYFAAWNLWSLAAAVMAAELLASPDIRRRLVRGLVLVPLCLGLLYPVLATWTKTDGFRPYLGRTLDGTAYLETVNPDEAAAIRWIVDNLEDGVLAEAVGGSYTGYARISAHTGIPTVLGWTFHEVQWRGDAALLGTREADIQQLYQTRDWVEAQRIVEQYGIDYVYLGPLERATYAPLVDRKFEAFMDVIYANDEVTVFAVRERSEP